CGLLDGTVKVESRVGEGSTFLVECLAPAAAEADTSAHSRQSMVQEYWAPALDKIGESANQALPKVVIAEDNLEMAAYIGTVLESVCQARFAKDGEQALQLVRTWSPDLILADVMMPK